MKVGYTRRSCLIVCLLFCSLGCLFVCLFDFCHKNDLNYKLNILGPLCLWQCFIWKVKREEMYCPRSAKNIDIAIIGSNQKTWIMIMCVKIKLCFRKDIPSYQQVFFRVSTQTPYKPGLVCKYNIQEMELVKGSAHALVY